MTCKVLAVLVCAAALFGQSTPPAEPLKPGLYAIFDTSEGTFTAELFEKYAKVSVKTFTGLAEGTLPWLDPKTKKFVKRPLYNGITFHRVLKNEMIQAGDPTGIGNHNCGFTIPDEYLPGLRFDRPGRLGMANIGKENSGGCQFFVTDQPMPSWNNHYAVFGQVVSGFKVVTTINRKPVKGDKPVNPVTLKRVTIVRVT